MAAEKRIKALRVCAKTEKKFRRAGFEFGRDPVDLPLDKLDKKQIAAIQAEPLLVVVEVEIEAPAKTE